MIFAASNIAWVPHKRTKAYASLQKYGFTGLEIAPRMFLRDSEDPFKPTRDEARAALDEAAGFGLRLVSMQSLLFGVADAAMFETPEKLSNFTVGMERAIDLAGQIGIPNLVFGSPGQRIRPEEMSNEDATARACEILVPLADRAQAAGTVIALEFNPTDYGTNFMNILEQVLAVVELASHPAIKVNFDVGAMYMNGAFDGIEATIAAVRHRISHVHISEPFLVPAPARVEDAVRVLAGLAAVDYGRAVSIEMKAVGEDGGSSELNKALERLALARDNSIETQQ